MSVTTYDPPLTADKLPEHLKDDPVHAWRARTGIELIHEEPTALELYRIWDNWQNMPADLKKISDAKSQELFGMTNAEHLLELVQLPKYAA
jgi:hypothetical protein